MTPDRWPDGAGVVVALSFDVDNGLPLVLDLLDRHDVPARVYIPAVSATLHTLRGSKRSSDGANARPACMAESTRGPRP